MGPRYNLHPPTVVAVQPALRHHDEVAAPLACLPIVHKLGRKAQSASHSHAEFVPHAVQMRLARWIVSASK